LPSAVICWLLVSSLCLGSVPPPSGSPMNHSTMAGAGRGSSTSIWSAAAGVVGRDQSGDWGEAVLVVEEAQCDAGMVAVVECVDGGGVVVVGPAVATVGRHHRVP
jgi:hypothetical protein